MNYQWWKRRRGISPVQVRRCVSTDGSAALVYSEWCWTSERCCSECPSVRPEHPHIQINTSNTSSLLRRWARRTHGELHGSWRSTFLFLGLDACFTVVIWKKRFKTLIKYLEDAFILTKPQCNYYWLRKRLNKHWFSDTNTNFTHNPSLSDNTAFYCTITVCGV